MQHICSSELCICDNKIPKNKLEAMNPVYVSQVYEDISSDQDFEPEFVKLKIDVLYQFSLLDQMVNNLGKTVEDNLVDFLYMGETSRNSNSVTAGENNMGNEQLQE